MKIWSAHLFARCSFVRRARFVVVLPATRPIWWRPHLRESAVRAVDYFCSQPALSPCIGGGIKRVTRVQLQTETPLRAPSKARRALRGGDQPIGVRVAQATDFAAGAAIPVARRRPWAERAPPMSAGAVPGVTPGQ